MSLQKEKIRFTFDCPVDLHTAAKMRASAMHQSLKDYLINLVAKDIVENPIQFLDKKSFKKQLKKILNDDDKLMQELSKR